MKRTIKDFEAYLSKRSRYKYDQFTVVGRSEDGRYYFQWRDSTLSSTRDGGYNSLSELMKNNVRVVIPDDIPPENIDLGQTYFDKYLATPLSSLGGNNRYGPVHTLSRKRTEYGWRIAQGTNFISISDIKLEIYKDGKAKAIVKVNKNYVAPYQYTLYFDTLGREIKDEHNRTRKELAYWKNL